MRRLICAFVVRIYGKNTFSHDVAQRSTAYPTRSLTHLCLASRKCDIGKHCKPRSDAAERGVWSWSTLFAYRNFYSNNKNAKSTPDIAKFGNELAQLIRMEKSTGQFKYMPGHEKMCLMPYANNKGADQPAHPRSQISAFVVRCQDRMIPLVYISEISRF